MKMITWNICIKSTWKDITSVIDKHAPITKRQLTKRKHKIGYDKDALKLKIQRRKAEKTWRKIQLE